MFETSLLRPLPKMYQTYNSAVGKAVPKTPLRVHDLGQRMDSNPTIGKGVYAFRDHLHYLNWKRPRRMAVSFPPVGEGLAPPGDIAADLKIAALMIQNASSD